MTAFTALAGRIGAAALGLALSAAAAYAQGHLLEQGRDLLRQQQGPQGGGSRASGLTGPQAESGLREALRVATQRTVSRVGRTDGYLKDPAIRIPLPGFLQTAKQGLGAVGAAGMLEDLETRMNRAAEAAAPQAFDIFANAISSMSVRDARDIVAGPNDAATQYFRRTTSAPLTAAFRPVVDRSLADAGAIQAYDGAVQRLGSGQLGGLAGALGGSGGAGFDFTGFVVDKALAGLFHYVGQEEAAIRTNPAARTTDLLKTVFGSR